MIASKSKYVVALRRILFDDAKTYQEHFVVTSDDDLKRMDADFKAAKAKVQGMQFLKACFILLKTGKITVLSTCIYAQSIPCRQFTSQA